MTRALVVGLGSIGRRHVRVLAKMGCEVAVVSRRPTTDHRRFPTLVEGVDAFRPDYVVVATETAAHHHALVELAGMGFCGAVLVEKPLGAQPGPLPPHRFHLAAVAYNLRFHPALQALARELAGQSVVSCQIYCGQYLPDWRPECDYRHSYSASRTQGGGVLRDLSHELDYLLWLCGPWRRVAALGGRFGGLDIDSDDTWGVLAELRGCPVASLQVNYLDRPGRRDVLVNTRDHTFHLDMVRGQLDRDGVVASYACDRDHTYVAQHQAVLAGDRSSLCSLEQGDAVMRLIVAAERAASTGCWVSAS